MITGTDTHPPKASPRWRGALLFGTLLGVVALIYGIVQFELLAQWPMRGASLVLWLLGLVLLPSLLLSRLLQKPLAIGLLATFGLLTLAFVGLGPSLAALILLAGAVALASRLFGSSSGLPLAAVVIAGLALIGMIVGWMLPFSVHYRWFYLLLALALVVPQRRQLLHWLRDALHGVEAAARATPALSAAATLVLIGAALPAWMPSLMFDDLGYHLALPNQLQQLGHYRMDAGSQVWAFAPWLGDSLYAVAQVLAGEDARGPVNLIWLGAAAALMFQLTSKLWPGYSSAGWIALALFASLPVNAVLVAGMQTELIAIALLLAALHVLLATDVAPAARRRAIVLLLGGLALTKTSMLPFAVVLAIAFAWRHRNVYRLPHLLSPLPLALLLGGSAYTYAWVYTGNPILPIANEFFGSHYYPLRNFSNPLYLSSMDAASFWALLFDSSRFYGGRDGISGMHWLPLLPAALLACCLRHRLALLAIAALALTMLQFSVQSHLRYLLPAMCLMIPAYAAGASLLGRFVGTGLALLLAGASLAFQPNTHWIFWNESAIASVFDAASGRTPLRDRVAPELRLVELALLHAPQAQILLTNPERPYTAAAAGRAFTTSWYDTRLRTAFGDGSAERVHNIFSNHSFTHAVVYPRDRSPGAAEQALEGVGASLVARNGRATLWQLPKRNAGIDLYALRDRHFLATLRDARENYRSWHRGRKLRHPERYAPVTPVVEPD